MKTKTNQCPNCKTENRAEAQYCLGCGKALKSGPAEPEHSSVGSGPTAPSEAASEPAQSIGSVGTDRADELVFDSPPAPDKPPKPPSPAPDAATPPSEPESRKPTTQNQRGLSRAPVRPKPTKTDVSPKRTGTRATTQTDLPKTERKPADEKPERRTVKRTTYASLCDKSPGHPFLAVLGSGEPSQGYAIPTDATDEDEDVAGRIVLKGTAEAGPVTSDGSPILIGSHDTCGMQIEGDSVAMCRSRRQ